MCPHPQKQWKNRQFLKESSWALKKILTWSPRSPVTRICWKSGSKSLREWPGEVKTTKCSHKRISVCALICVLDTLKINSLQILRCTIWLVLCVISSKAFIFYGLTTSNILHRMIARKWMTHWGFFLLYHENAVLQPQYVFCLLFFLSIEISRWWLSQISP